MKDMTVNGCRILNCDVLEGLRSLETESVNCIVTSPPYSRLFLVATKLTKALTLRNIFRGEGKVLHSPVGSPRIWKSPVARDHCAMILAVGLMLAQSQNGFRLGAFDSQIGQQHTNHGFSFGVRSLPAKQRSTLRGVRLLGIVPTPYRLGQEPNSPLVNHSHLNDGVIAGIDAPRGVSVWFGSLDSDAALSVNDSSAIRQISLLAHIIQCTPLRGTRNIIKEGEWKN